MKRRHLILGSGAVLSGSVAGTAAMTFRWHGTAQRFPALSDQHLATLRPSTTKPSVLFVGNSMTLRNDLPALVAGLAREQGVVLQVGTAAARGARLVETLRIDAFREVLRSGWDVVVLQDFSTTCLRGPDRWGSVLAMEKIAKDAQPASVLLYPTWAFPPQHPVYRQGAGLFSRIPEDPEAFSRCIIDHYDAIATAQGWSRAKVPEAMQPDSTPWLGSDLHHPNEAGSARIAQALWDSLRPLL